MDQHSHILIADLNCILLHLIGTNNNDLITNTRQMYVRYYIMKMWLYMEQK